VINPFKVVQRQDTAQPP